MCGGWRKTRLDLGLGSKLTRFQLDCPRTLQPASRFDITTAMEGSVSLRYVFRAYCVGAYG